MPRLRPLPVLSLGLVLVSLLGARCGVSTPLSPATATADLSFNFKRAVAVGDDGATHVVWHDDRAGRHRVFYRRALVGSPFAQEVPITPGAVLAEHASVATEGPWVYVAYHEGGPSGQDVWLRRSNDGGASFGAAIRVSTSGASALAALAATGEHLHAVWMDDSAPTSEVWVRSSSDRGSTWGPIQRLSDTPYESWVPAIAADGPQVSVAWVDYRDANEEVYLRHSVDAGASFGPAQRLTTDPADSWAPSLAMAGPYLAIAWFDRRDSPVSDAEVEEPLDIALALLGLPPDPSPPRDPNVYYLPLFEARVARKLAAIQAQAPGWVAGGGDPVLLQTALTEFELRHQAWVAGFSVFLRRSRDGGASFGPAQRLSTPAGPALRPSLALYGDALHVAWFDGRHGDFDVFTRHSSDRGASFGPEVRRTFAASESLRPAIAAAPGRVELVWRDDRHGLPRIFHRRIRIAPADASGAAGS